MVRLFHDFAALEFKDEANLLIQFVLALVGIVYAGLALKQWKSTAKQAALAGEALELTRRDLHLSHRPWVLLERTQPVQFHAGIAESITVCLKSTGSSPALYVTVVMGHSIGSLHSEDEVLTLHVAVK